MDTAILALIIAVLNDDHGINEIAWGYLWRLYEVTEDENLYKLLSNVEAVDGRYFITEEGIKNL